MIFEGQVKNIGIFTVCGKRLFVTIDAAHRKGFEITDSAFLVDKRAAWGNVNYI